MKRFSLILLLILIPSLAFGAYTISIDKDLDYYRTLEESGITVPMSYQAAPTAETLRDALIAAGLMSGAPIAIIHGEVFEDVNQEVFADVGNEVWEDYTN